MEYINRRDSNGATPPVVVPFVDLAAQYHTIAPEVEDAIGRVLSRCDFILGTDLEVFEHAFAAFVGAEHGIGVSSGLDALSLSLRALDIGPGDEVIVPANTYIATALAVSVVGARPILVDCDLATYNIDVAAIEPALTPRTRAIIPVHFAGQAVDVEAVLDIARRHRIHVIEDAAHAHGSMYKGRPCGSLGIMGCFSFYPGKNLGAYGDGGMVTTNDARLAERLRRLRNYGQRAKYEHSERGMNARLDTLQAAILGVKLRYLPQWNVARHRLAEVYGQRLRGLSDLHYQSPAAYSTHVYHLFIIETRHRDALQEHLAAAGVQTGIHYPKPIHLQQAYAGLGYCQGDFPRAEWLADRMLSLPMFPELDEAQICYIVETICRFFHEQVQSYSSPEIPDRSTP